MLDDAITFIHSFFSKEYNALVAQYTERDDKLFEASRQELEIFVAADVRNEAQRPPKANERWFDVGERMVNNDQVAPRTLFQIKAYRHPNFGTLYRAYASLPVPPRAKGIDYFTNFYIIFIDGHSKIISRYDLDILPEPNAEKLKDNSLTWVYHSGEVLNTLGDLLKVRKFQAPNKPNTMREYEAE